MSRRSDRRQRRGGGIPPPQSPGSSMASSTGAGGGRNSNPFSDDDGTGSATGLVSPLSMSGAGGGRPGSGGRPSYRSGGGGGGGETSTHSRQSIGSGDSGSFASGGSTGFAGSGVSALVSPRRRPGGGGGGGQDQKPSSSRPSYRMYDRPSPQQEAVEEGTEEDGDEPSDREDVDNNDDSDRGSNSENRLQDGPAAVAKDDPDAARHIETSKGTQRLNRLLSKNIHGDTDTSLGGGNFVASSSGGLNASKSGDAAFLFDNVTPPSQQALMLRQQHQLNKIERIRNVRDIDEVAAYVARTVLPPLRVDMSSIGGALLEGYPATMRQETLVAFHCHSFESTNATETVAMSALQYPVDYAKHKRKLGLLSPYVASGSKAKSRSAKVRFVIVARSTNKPLVERLAAPIDRGGGGGVSGGGGPGGGGGSGTQGGGGGASGGNRDDSERAADYDAMFAPEGDDDDLSSRSLSATDDSPTPVASATPTAPVAGNTGATASTTTSTTTTTKGNPQQSSNEAEEEEVSSFPVLVCMMVNSDGTSPDIRKLIQLDQLTTVQDLHSTVVQLAFANGDTVRLDFGGGGIESGGGGAGGGGGGVVDDEKAAVDGSMEKERFIWSLLQIHAILCVSVVERSSMTSTARATTGNKASGGKDSRAYMPPLNVRNMDRAELQYVATVNNFLRQSEVLMALLDRQRKLITKEASGAPPAWSSSSGAAAAGAGGGRPPHMEEMDVMAYDMMMGNFATRVSIFSTEEERKDAEEILNMPGLSLSSSSTTATAVTAQQDGADPNASDATTGAAIHTSNMALLSVAERLSLQLQMRMRDLEGETCRRLIAWEDEKSKGKRRGGASDGDGDGDSNTAAVKSSSFTDDRDTVDALALASLFKMLESLDEELHSMEEWLQQRAAAIKPLTDDCADIEEENRQLEQQWKSYDMLGAEMRRLLTGLEIPDKHERVLRNPASALVYQEDGTVNVKASEPGVDEIYEAGKALEEAMEYPKRSGGMHLAAVAERHDRLTAVVTKFSTALANIIVTVMEQFKSEVVAGSDYGKVSKSDTHAMIAKKVRDTQRKFQSSLLGYIKLIEILSALSPHMLPALRDAYSEMVSEGILMKKRMKGYFQALPGKNAAYLNRAGKDLKDYVPFDEFMEETVNAPDIRAVLQELLPVIAREAYFTSALFGPSSKQQDGREKKRNFESVRTAVDSSSQHFRYYINRTCGIFPDDGGGRATSEISVRGDPMLCLTASIYLNETMDNYIDREKKGGDQSLSLAYVRATILDLRKRADKQWVVWVDKQIDWIKSHDGVPLSGKRAGIFPSFARFPVFLDHVLLCCREGREDLYTPDMSSIKVVNYYMQKMASCLLESLKECANRETTDKDYGRNVMQMENTYYFTQAIKQRGPIIADLFAKQVTKANAICKESTDAYLGWMIKREFRALHELFSRISKLRKDVGDKEVVSHVRKNEFVKILSKEANKDVLKDKIGSMYGRMEKHLSEEGGLVPVAWKALVKVLYEWFGRWEKLSTQIYRHKLDPSAVDVVRIAKAAGGTRNKGVGSTGGGSHHHRTAEAGGDKGEFGFKNLMALKQQQQQQQHASSSSRRAHHQRY